MINEKVISIIAKQLNISTDNITLETTVKSLGADSLDMADIVFELERVFDITVKDTDNIATIVTVADAIQYVLDKQ